MAALACRLAAKLTCPEIIYLSGPPGAGKTTLVRELLLVLGHVGPVRSPTYTLYETYQIHPAGGEELTIHHLDLYRLSDPEELDYIGLRDLLAADLILVEWPENGAGQLPEPTLSITLNYNDGPEATGQPVMGRTVIITRLDEAGGNPVLSYK